MSHTPQRARHLLTTPAFTTPTHALSRSEKTRYSYERARATVQAYRQFVPSPANVLNIDDRAGLTIDDILTLSPKFWEIHQDPLMALDGGAMTLTTIQVNLTSGTLARQAVHRPELIPLVEDLLSFRKGYGLCSCRRSSSHPCFLQRTVPHDRGRARARHCEPRDNGDPPSVWRIHSQHPFTECRQVRSLRPSVRLSADRSVSGSCPRQYQRESPPSPSSGRS